jgi:hypothetical protein
LQALGCCACRLPTTASVLPEQLKSWPGRRRADGAAAAGHCSGSSCCGGACEPWPSSSREGAHQRLLEHARAGVVPRALARSCRRRRTSARQRGPRAGKRHQRHHRHQQLAQPHQAHLIVAVWLEQAATERQHEPRRVRLGVAAVGIADLSLCPEDLSSLVALKRCRSPPAVLASGDEPEVRSSPLPLSLTPAPAAAAAPALPPAPAPTPPH